MESRMNAPYSPAATAGRAAHSDYDMNARQPAHEQGIPRSRLLHRSRVGALHSRKFRRVPDRPRQRGAQGLGFGHELRDQVFRPHPHPAGPDRTGQGGTGAFSAGLCADGKAGVEAGGRQQGSLRKRLDRPVPHRTRRALPGPAAGLLHRGMPGGGTLPPHP